MACVKIKLAGLAGTDEPCRPLVRTKEHSDGCYGVLRRVDEVTAGEVLARKILGRSAMAD